MPANNSASSPWSSHWRTIIHGATGVGKIFIGACFAQAACTLGYRALCVRVPRLVHQLAITRADGTFVTELGRLSRLDLIVLDDFLSSPMKDSEKRDLIEVLEDRYDNKSTIKGHQLQTRTDRLTTNSSLRSDFSARVLRTTCPSVFGIGAGVWRNTQVAMVIQSLCSLGAR